MSFHWIQHSYCLKHHEEEGLIAAVAAVINYNKALVAVPCEKSPNCRCSVAGAQQKFGPESVADRRTGCDVSTGDVTADAVSGADCDDRVSPAANDHVRHDEELSAHARTANGGDSGRRAQYSGRLFPTHRLPGSSPRLQLVGELTVSD